MQNVVKPRVAPQALPWVGDQREIPTLKGLWIDFSPSTRIQHPHSAFRIPNSEFSIRNSP